MVTEIKFGPIGYFSGQIPNRQALSVVDNQEEWSALAKLINRNDTLPKVDFSKKKVIVVIAELDNPSQWLLVEKVEQTASKILNIEFGDLSTQPFGLCVFRYATQFITIDKDIESSELHIVQLGKETLDELVPELALLKKELDCITTQEQHLFVKIQRKYGSYFWNEYILGTINVNDIVNPKQRGEVADHAQLKSRKDKLKAIYDRNYAVISHQYRGPSL